MATNYLADPSATEAPSAAPGPGVLPTVVIPADGEAASAASITQSIKTIADFIGYGQQNPKSINSDGFDGSVTLDGVVAAPSWATKVGTVY